MATDIQAQLRQLSTKSHLRNLRLEGTVPAVIYGAGIENKTIQVERRYVERVLKTMQGRNTYINLKVESDNDYGVLIKDFDADVITRTLKHVDFWVVDAAKKVEANVRVSLTGRAEGTKHGGVQEQISHRVRLLCEAGNIPEELVVDVTNLQVNQNIHLSDVGLPTGVSAREGYNPTIVSIVGEKAAVEPAAPAEEAATDTTAEAKPEEAKKA